MYLLCAQEKAVLSYDDVLGLVPTLLSELKESHEKQEEALKNASADQLPKVKERIDKEAAERQKKVADTLAEGKKFDFDSDKLATIASLVQQQASCESGSFEVLGSEQKQDEEL